ncbi:hypothetical protein PBCVNEJV1_390L [Paramecium bursaria Chlorella virus NE-JV-1]|nr:hypothetical protein PBCVNEJV1_390L [Paramecium bursaria Chlorella virus NE-JV-1]
MWLFIFAVLLVILFAYRKKIASFAQKNKKTRGVEVPLLKRFKMQYPTYCKNAYDHLAIFNEKYQDTFDYDNANVDIVNDLFSIRDDVLYNISEIRLRLPNDLQMEKAIVRAHEQADRRMLEYITDTKTRFNSAIFPGQTSSAFYARNYRAADDVVL